MSGIMNPKAPKCQLLSNDEIEELSNYYTDCELGFCQIGENKCFLPASYEECGKSIQQMGVKGTDRWVVTFPRSGTTWIQELVWLINNDFNYEEAAKRRIAERYFFLELMMMKEKIDTETNADKKESEKPLATHDSALVDENLGSLRSPRFFKTHLPFELLPPDLLDSGCKVVYVARNPKDVIVSLYYFNIIRPIFKFNGDFAAFWNFFRRNLSFWCPFWSHVKKAWSLRHHPNLLFLFYEEMKMDLPGVIRKTSEFYERPCTVDEVKKLSCHLSFDSFKENPMIGSGVVNGRALMSKNIFVRRGQIGGWKELFTPELEAEADKWIAENLRDTDLVFPHVQSTEVVERR